MSSTFSNEAEQERKQYARHHECVLKGTKKCNGWKKDADPEHSCANCKRKHTCRAISLNETFDDEEGNKIEFGSTIEDEFSDTVEEIALKHSNLGLLRTAIGCLNEDDQKFIRDCYGEKMNFVKLAKMYGIDRHYASKRAKRIENRIRKNISEI